MYTWETPYVITGVKQITVSTTAQTVDLAGRSAIIQNTGSSALYISNTTATTSDFKIASGASLSPITGTLSAISDGTSDVRILFLDPTS